MKNQIIFFVCVTLCLIAIFSVICSRVTIHIPKGYSGWVFVVGNSSNKYGRNIAVNNQGVGYLDTSIINGSMFPAIYMDGKKLDDSRYKYFSYSHIMPVETKNITLDSAIRANVARRMLFFYVLGKEDFYKGDDYWTNFDTSRLYSRKEWSLRDSLLNVGVIKVK